MDVKRYLNEMYEIRVGCSWILFRSKLITKGELEEEINLKWPLHDYESYQATFSWPVKELYRMK